MKSSPAIPRSIWMLGFVSLFQARRIDQQNGKDNQ